MNIKKPHKESIIRSCAVKQFNKLYKSEIIISWIII